MVIVAKTAEGVLISATSAEAIEIIRSVSGNEPKELSIGQKIPAIDYASSITKIKSLKDNYYFKEIVEAKDSFADAVEKLKKAVEDAALVEA